jgi:spore coat protein U-like protein
VAGLPTVKACVSAATAAATATISATLLGPADSDLSTLDFGSIEVFDGFLSVLFFIEIDEAKAALLILFKNKSSITFNLQVQEPILENISSNSPGSISLGMLPINKLIVKVQIKL